VFKKQITCQLGIKTFEGFFEGKMPSK